jgi:hypothetical protein
VQTVEQRITALEKQIKELQKICLPMLAEAPVTNPDAEDKIERKSHSRGRAHHLTHLQEMEIVNDYQNHVPGKVIQARVLTSPGNMYAVLWKHGIALNRNHGQATTGIKV